MNVGGVHKSAAEKSHYYLKYCIGCGCVMMPNANHCDKSYFGDNLSLGLFVPLVASMPDRISVPPGFKTR